MHRASPASTITTWIAPTSLAVVMRASAMCASTMPALLVSLLLASTLRAAATFPRYKPARGKAGSFDAWLRARCLP